MNRRHFFKTLGLSSVAASMPASFNLFAAPEEYAGKFLITIQAEGGWDVTSFCDPKVNVAGELPINNWANNGEPGQAGNISYAAFANNQAFFEKYYRDMLVVNGVDAQTNSHTAGVVHNWSGRLSDGFPSITSLFAAQYGSSLPVGYISNGGYSVTGGLTRYTQLDNVRALNQVIYPNNARWNDGTWLHENDWQRVREAQQQRLEQMMQAEQLTAQQRASRNNFQSSLQNSSILSDFATALNNVGDLEEPRTNNNQYSSLSRQAQIAVMAMTSGVCVSADLVMGGYDTHDNHDEQHTWLYTELARSIDYLWTYAEIHGIADRLVVMVGSDFGRTPHYNDGEGKDHWPISSYIVMERGAGYTNRTIGQTDEGHNTIPIDALTGREDQQNGHIIHPSNVLSELRDYLDVQSLALDNNFSLATNARFGFFDS